MPYHIEDDNEDCQGFAVVIDDDGEVMGCHRSNAQAERQMAALYASESDDKQTHTTPDGTVMAGATHGERAPAPSSEQIKGSDKNEPGSASAQSGDISINDATEKALQNKADTHNEIDAMQGTRRREVEKILADLRAVRYDY